MKSNKEYIALEGEKFTIEWYFSEDDKSVSLDYYKSLDIKYRAKLLNLFKLISDTGEIKNKEKFRNEGNSIYTFKPQPYRFLCFFFEGQKIIITNAFYKDTQKLPKNEKIKALDIKKDYELRIKEGNYYE